MNRILVMDMSNILYKTFYVKDDKMSNHIAHKSLPQEEKDDLEIRSAFHRSLVSLNRYYLDHSPTTMICVFDRFNWRDDYSKSEECYSKRVYKGTRRQKQTPAEQQQYQRFKQFTNEFEVMLTEMTAIPCLSANLLEADDIIAGLCKIYGGNDTAPDNGSTFDHTEDHHEVTIVSADKDMIQLLRYDRVKLLDPATKKYRTLENTGNESVDLYLYVKYMRGDRGDNVASAFPRYRLKKIVEAYEDPYKHTNLMKSEWTDHEGNIMVVGEIFNENKLLTNLTHQPKHIQDIMLETILTGLNSPKRFDRFQFVKFLKNNKLNNVNRLIDSYIPLLSMK
jgi:5'-3' exonuclease